MSERDQLIREAATVDLDVEGWRDRLEQWLGLTTPCPANFKQIFGITFPQ
jgi:hypothetical protein